MSRGVPIPPVGSWATKLDRERVVRGLTYEELGKLAGVSHWTVSRACRGKRVTFAMAVRLWMAVRSRQPNPDLVEVFGPEGTV